jgi:hypothetical protein
MRVVAMIVLLSSTCVGSESISGIWSLNRHKSTKATRPIAIQIQQTGDHLYILRIVAGKQGKFVENILISVVDIRSTRADTRMTIPGSLETWTLRRGGELVIKRKAGGRRYEAVCLGPC